MTDLQAWVAGFIAGKLMREAASHELLDISVEVDADEEGNYKPEFLITGNRSGQRVRVFIVVAEDGP